MPSNFPAPVRIVYDHEWQDPASPDYDPLRVILETPAMRQGRKEYVTPRPPDPSPQRQSAHYPLITEPNP